MKTFTIFTTNVDRDIDVLTDYLTETMTLSWSDEERVGYSAMLEAVQNTRKNNLGMYTIRFHMGEETAHRIMQNILHDVDELYPYASEPLDDYYYNRKVSVLLHVVSMMMNPFFLKGE